MSASRVGDRRVARSLSNIEIMDTGQLSYCCIFGCAACAHFEWSVAAHPSWLRFETVLRHCLNISIGGTYLFFTSCGNIPHFRRIRLNGRYNAPVYSPGMLCSCDGGAIPRNTQAISRGALRFLSEAMNDVTLTGWRRIQLMALFFPRMSSFPRFTVSSGALCLPRSL